MNVLAINASPRKNWNTATLLKETLAGASSKGATTELIHLCDLSYKGCVSCFGCKLKQGKSYGKCAYKDELSPVLEKIEKANAVIFGSPIYLGDVTGQLRLLWERLLFQYLVYEGIYSHSSLLEKKKPIGIIYTMNVTDALAKEYGYEKIFAVTEMFISNILGPTESLSVTDTYQFDDYSKYVITTTGEDAKAKKRKEIFPQECERAFAMGTRFATI